MGSLDTQAEGAFPPFPHLGPLDAVAGLLVALLVAFAFWEVAVGGRTLTTSIGTPGVNGTDAPAGYGPADVTDQVRVDRGASAWQFEPWAEVVHDQLVHGRVPLWNPWQGAGTPLAANMQSAVFDPVLLAVHLHPSPRVWDLTFLALFVGGGIATYALGRVLLLGPTASFAGAAAFVLSGFFMLHSNNQFIRVYLYLPVLFLLVEVVVRSPRLRAVAGLGFGVALTILAGMPEPAFFVLAAAGAFAVYRVLRGPRAGSRGRATLALVAGGALGLALSAPLILPFAEYLRVSFNLHTATTGLQADAAGRALAWIVPYVNGLQAAPGHPTGMRSWIGMAAPVLGVVALSAPGAMRRHRGWFFAAGAAVVLLKQFGVPAVQWIGRLPVADRLLFQVYSLPVAAFCLAMLAAVGVQAIEDGLVARRRLVAGLLLLGVVVGALAVLDADALGGSRARVLVEQFGIAAAAAVLVVVAAAGLPRAVAPVAAAAVLAGEWFVFAPAPGSPAWPYRVVVLTGAALLCLLLAGVRRMRRPAAVIAGVAVVAELLLLVPRGIYPRLWDPYLPPPWLPAVAREPDRVFGLGWKLYPDTAGVFAIPDVRTLDAVYVRRYVEYVRRFVEPDFDDRFTGAPSDEPTWPDREGNPMWDLLGVRSVLVPEGWGVGGFLDRLFAAVPRTGDVFSAMVDLGGDRRPALVMRGSREVVYPVYEREHRTVTFAYGVLPGGGGPVRLSVDAVTASGRIPVWDGGPVAAPGTVGGTWATATVDLGRVAEPVTGLVLRGEVPGAGARIAWAGLEVRGPDGAGSPAPDRLRLVMTAGGVQVWEDTGRMPRAFVVDRVHRVRSEHEAVARLSEGARRFADGAIRVEGFDPSREAVVEAGAGDLRSLTPGAAAGPGQRPVGAVRIASYDPDRVVLDVDAGRPGLVVLTDVFFPGWTATVNGQDAKVLPTDLAFRGVRVGAGRSTVVLRYRPTSFRLGLTIATLALAALAAVATAIAVRRRAGPGGRAARQAL